MTKPHNLLNVKSKNLKTNNNINNSTKNFYSRNIKKTQKRVYVYILIKKKDYNVKITKLISSKNKGNDRGYVPWIKINCTKIKNLLQKEFFRKNSEGGGILSLPRFPFIIPSVLFAPAETNKTLSSFLFISSFWSRKEAGGLHFGSANPLFFTFYRKWELLEMRTWKIMAIDMDEYLNFSDHNEITGQSSYVKIKRLCLVGNLPFLFFSLPTKVHSKY